MNKARVVAVAAIAFATHTVAIQAQTDLGITAFESNGQLTWSNVNPSLYYRLEWATELVNSNSWRMDYTPLIDVTSANPTITVGVPRFFRVVGGPQMLIPDATNVRSGTIVQGVSGTFWKGNRFDYENDANTIVDYKTGLMWTRSLSWTWVPWASAVTYCQSLDYAGYDDWRLPTREELEGIIGTGAFPDDSLDGNKPPFTGAVSDYYWSSTDNGSPDNAYRVRYGTSSTHFDSKSSGNNVWPVRTR
jgi:hypothetical protein